MAEEKPTYIIKKPPEPLAEIISSRDQSALEVFLDAPIPVIAQAIIELFEHGPVTLLAPGVRIVQGALKGNLFKQLAKEVNDLQQKGKIADNFAERKYGFQSWVELLTIIDEDTPDEDRLEALKAMFYTINKVNASDAEQILGYQLFQIAKRLTSNELLVLKAVYELCKTQAFKKGGAPTVSGFRDWAALVSKHLGHTLIALIEHADKALTENQLLSERAFSDRSAVQGMQQGRLTDLGNRFCENIEQYRIDKSS